MFTKTEAVVPGGGNAPPVLITAGVARYSPKAQTIEVFAEGTSNPWGVDFDARGNAFVSACVIDHLFHLAPGGIYARQAGQPPYPYGYELLPSIVNHRHHMAAYAGVCVYQGGQWPKSWQGEVLMGNIHQNAINHDHLEVDGSSFKAAERPDFLTTKDGWFMPVSSQVGPDGALWIMDWYDKYPCYQNANADPAGVDRERGRIWRIVWVGDHPDQSIPSHIEGLDFARLTSSELVDRLGHSNVWQRRMAQRILNGRTDVGQQQKQLEAVTHSGSKSIEARLAAFWTLYSTGLLTDTDLDAAAHDSEPGLRIWSARFTGEQRNGSDSARNRLLQLAADSEPTVRSAVATACRQWISGQLTVNAPLPEGADPGEPAAVLAALVEHSRGQDDPTLDFLIWTASEPLIMRHPENALRWYQQHGGNNLPLSAKLTFKTMRRFCDAHDPALLDLAVDFLSGVSETPDFLIQVALDGLIEGQRGKPLAPQKPVAEVLSRLQRHSNPAIIARAQRLGALWGDVSAANGLVARIQDTTKSQNERMEAIRAVRSSRVASAGPPLLLLVGSHDADTLKIEALHALGDVGADDTGKRVIASWSELTPVVRRAAAELLSAKTQWAIQFLAAIQTGEIKRGDVPPTVIRNLAGHRDPSVQAAAVKAFGRVQATSAEKLKLIEEKRRMVSVGPIDLEAGHEVAKRTCFICHKLYGEGAEIGPDLTGVGRSSLDALLHNVINPNEIIGQGYENVEVETKDGRTISGRMVESSDVRVRLLMSGPQEEVIAKGDIVRLKVSENSVMPEGLEQMPDADFRNLIWYILAPPQDGKPLTPARKKELLGDVQAANDPFPQLPDTDGESIALWAPGWQIDSGKAMGVPAKFPEWNGRANVLATRPHDRTTAAAIARPYVPPVGRESTLRFWVAAEPGAPWELRVVVDGEVILHKIIDTMAQRWVPIRADLRPFAGRRVVVRLENRSANGQLNAGFWADVQWEDGEYSVLSDIRHLP